MSTIAETSPTYDHPRPSCEGLLQMEPWYHGKITRYRSECLVQCEGDFLVIFRTFALDNTSPPPAQLFYKN